jgi:hypothetical protein
MQVLNMEMDMLEMDGVGSKSPKAKVYAYVSISPSQGV